MIVSIILAITTPLFVKALLKRLNLKNVHLEKGLFIAVPTVISSLLGGGISFIAIQSSCTSIRKKQIKSFLSKTKDAEIKEIYDFIQEAKKSDPDKEIFNYKRKNFKSRAAVYEFIDGSIIFSKKGESYFENNVNGHNNIDKMELEKNIIKPNKKKANAYFWNSSYSKNLRSFENILMTIAKHKID